MTSLAEESSTKQYQKKNLGFWRIWQSVVEKKQRRKAYLITSLETSMEVYMNQERHNFTFHWAQDYLEKNAELEWMGLIVWSHFHIVYVAGEVKD